ncbi:MAG TPA: TonB-dependent receptor [Gemmatimonadales bacterium]|nr:TonB-dependent receptor [Gemmatimonadales bacterium]
MAPALRTFLLPALFLVSSSSLAAQGGTLTGRVTNAEGGRPLSGAVVRVLLPNGAVLAGAGTRADGAYRLSDLPAGTYLVRVAAVGFAPQDFAGTAIRAGASTTLNASLALQATRLADIAVTTVSREPEKKTDAPAAVFAISHTEVEERPALSVVDHLKSVPGVDISQGGLVQSNVVARGFNNIFSGALLTLIDYRYAAVPSLRVNVPTFFPVTSDDIERIEFVLGPGAALYGPNASNGVLNIVTRSPFSSTGTTLSFEAGVRAGSTKRVCGSPSCSDPSFEPLDKASGLWRFSARHAMRLGTKVAFKLSGSYLTGTEWQERDPAEPSNLDVLHPELGLKSGQCNSTTGCRDFNLEQWGGEARVDVRPDANTELIGDFGLTDAKSLIEYTGIGAAQARGWRYSSAQLRVRHKRLFVQAFGNFSGAGIDSSGSAPRARAFLLRDGSPIVDQSRVWSVQAQHGFDLFRGRENLLYGVDYINTDARTGGTINGSNEDDDTINEYGAYLHGVTHFTPKLDLVAALRVDKHSRLGSAVWSPRIGLVFKPDERQAFRLTFNRAFSTPTNNDLFLDIVAGRIPLSPTVGYDIRALGVPKQGFQFRVAGACPTGGAGDLCMRTPFNPAAGVLPARASLLWSAAVQAVSASVGPQLTALMLGNAPTTQVGTQLRRLNPTTAQFIDMDPTAVQDIARLEPTISHALEAGYKGLIGRKFQISADAWYEHKRNFTGPLIVESPTVFLDRASTITYLTALYTAAGVPNPAATATQVGTAMAGLSAATSIATTGVPLGTVIPTNSTLTERPDIFLTYRDFGKVDLWGADLALDYVVNSYLSFSGSYSWVNKDFFPKTEVNGPTDIALNASRSKGSLTAAWRDDPKGWGAEVRFRAVKGFPVNSGVYVSSPDPDNPEKLLPTDSYGVVDMQGTWRPPIGSRNMLLTASLQNLFNKHYATFVGVPNLGRLLLTKVSYTF